MERAESLEAFVVHPLNRWVVAGSCIAWCASPWLGGASVWGSPDVETTRAILRAFEAVWARTMGRHVDVVLDARRIERIDPESLAYLVEWSARHRDAAARVVRQQIGVVSRDVVGVTLAGVLPMIGDTHPFRVVHDPEDAHRVISGEAGVALCREIESLVGAVHAVPAEVRCLRELLRDAHGSMSIVAAARALGTSKRSLQRNLAAHGTSFQRELCEARFRAALDLISTSDEKIAAVAGRIGLSEGTLTHLFRERTGRTPSEFRRQTRDHAPLRVA